MFRTEFTIPPVDFQIGLAAKILTIGSCFADVVGTQLKEHKIETLINPFGTLFNPVSACQLLTQAIQQTKPSDKWVQNQGIWHHYDFHSSFSSPYKSQLEQQIENSLRLTHTFLQKADYILLTLGTAYVYELKETHTIVANCHKEPAKNFTRYLLTNEQINLAFEQMHRAITEIRPTVKFILTVSPVRHTKDTLPLNQVSKSILRVSTHQLTQQFDNVCYFPAYELLIDDLRDYRFYKADMIHPSEVAEEYIWDKFIATYLNKDAKEFIEAWQSIRKALMHKPFHAHTAAHQQFLKTVLQKLEVLTTQVDVQTEMDSIRKQII